MEANIGLTENNSLSEPDESVNTEQEICKENNKDLSTDLIFIEENVTFEWVDSVAEPDEIYRNKEVCEASNSNLLYSTTLSEADEVTSNNTETNIRITYKKRKKRQYRDNSSWPKNVYKVARKSVLEYKGVMRLDGKLCLRWYIVTISSYLTIL